MITTDKVTDIFCILDEFCKNLDAELTKNLHIAPIDEGYKRMRNRKGQIVQERNHDHPVVLSFWLFPQLQALLPLLHQGASGKLLPLRPCPTRVSWNSCLACSSSWWPSCASKVLESARALVSWTARWFPYATTWEGISTRCLMDLLRTEREQWGGVMVSASSAVQRDGRCTHVLPNSRKRGRQGP